MVGSGSSGHFCPDCEPKFCPICGSELREVRYSGKNPKYLDLMKQKGFRYLLGCLRVDLHDTVLHGVDCRGQVYVLGAIFSDVSGG